MGSALQGMLDKQLSAIKEKQGKQLVQKEKMKKAILDKFKGAMI